MSLKVKLVATFLSSGLYLIVKDGEGVLEVSDRNVEEGFVPPHVLGQAGSRFPVDGGVIQKLKSGPRSEQYKEEIVFKGSKIEPSFMRYANMHYLSVKI
jgi:hypothetical protein